MNRMEENTKDITTKDLIKELSKRKEIKILECGLYKEYEVDIKSKFSREGTQVELPNECKLIILSYS